MDVFEPECDIGEAEAIFWCRVNQVKVAFDGEEASVLVGPAPHYKLFVGKDLNQAVTQAREYLYENIGET